MRRRRAPLRGSVSERDGRIARTKIDDFGRKTKFPGYTHPASRNSEVGVRHLPQRCHARAREVVQRCALDQRAELHPARPGSARRRAPQAAVRERVEQSRDV
jgi:hypothetical protein